MRRRDPTSAQLARIERLALRVAKTRGRARHETALVLADLVEEAGYPTPNRIATGRRGPPQKFNVFLLDAWGNAADGYEVNNRFLNGEIRVPQREYVFNVTNYRDKIRTGFVRADAQPLLRTIWIDHRYTTEDLRRALSRANYRVKHAVIDDLGDGMIEITSKVRGKPLAHLEAID